MKQKTLRVFEAFAGIGTQRMALDNLNIQHEVVAISEIDKFAIESYQAIHGQTLNLGDISQIKPEDIPDHDLFTYSFPCTDLSSSGLGKGLTKDSGTSSSLLWECEKVIKYKRPNYLLMENVKNLISKKFKPEFEKWLKLLEGYGYTNTYYVLNAADYGIPQNRERVFCISILGDHSDHLPKNPIPRNRAVKDILESESLIDEKYYLTPMRQERFQYKPNYRTDIHKIGTTKKSEKNIGQRDIVYGTTGIMGALVASDYRQPKQIGIPQDEVVAQLEELVGKTRSNLEIGITVLPNKNLRPHKLDARKSGIQEAYIIHEDNPSNTVTTSHMPKVYGPTTLYRIRKLTPLECWRLMGITDDNFDKARTVSSDTQLYKQAGNAIVVQVLEAIFGTLLAEYIV